MEAVMKEKAAAVQPDLDAHKTPDSWAREAQSWHAKRSTLTVSC